MRVFTLDFPTRDTPRLFFPGFACSPTICNARAAFQNEIRWWRCCAIVYIRSVDSERFICSRRWFIVHTTTIPMCTYVASEFFFFFLLKCFLAANETIDFERIRNRYVTNLVWPRKYQRNNTRYERKQLICPRSWLLFLLIVVRMRSNVPIRDQQFKRVKPPTLTSEPPITRNSSDNFVHVFLGRFESKTIWTKTVYA